MSLNANCNYNNKIIDAILRIGFAFFETITGNVSGQEIRFNNLDKIIAAVRTLLEIFRGFTLRDLVHREYFARDTDRTDKPFHRERIGSENNRIKFPTYTRLDAELSYGFVRKS